MKIGWSLKQAVEGNYNISASDLITDLKDLLLTYAAWILSQMAGGNGKISGNADFLTDVKYFLRAATEAGEHFQKNPDSIDAEYGKIICLSMKNLI